jgi:hypothetical protein
VQERPLGLHLDEAPELGEREAEEVAQPDDLAERLDVVFVVEAVLALRALAGLREEADLP